MAVESMRGLKHIPEKLGKGFGVTSEVWPTCVDAQSLAQRAILALGQRYAQKKQRSVEDFVADKAEHVVDACCTN